MGAPDKKAVYDRRTETVKTGDGYYVRMKDLYQRLATLNQVQLDKLIKRGGLRGAVGDPYDGARSKVVEDLVDLCRTRPQYCKVVLEAAQSLDGAAGARFQDLLRDRFFGSTGDAEVSPEPVSAGKFDKGIGQFFFDTRGWSGEYQLFMTQDGRVLTLSPGERFDGHEPYELCFVLVRTEDGRYWIRWPEQYRHEPAWYMDELGRPVWFFPHTVDGEDLDFEELFPAHVYQVFGLQFQLPDIGTDYSVYYDDDLSTWKEWDPSDRKNPSAADAEAYARATAEARARGEAPPPPPPALSEQERLLAILGLKPGQVSTGKELSKHFRTLSLSVHPLKHLDAPEHEKVKINARYQELSAAYNALKVWYT